MLKSLPLLRSAAGTLAALIVACSSDGGTIDGDAHAGSNAGGASGSGGQPVNNGGVPSTSGAPTAGSSTGGTPSGVSGQPATGGQPANGGSGGMSQGGSATGGTSTGGASGGSIPMGNDPVKSAGCSKPLGTLKSGIHTIKSSNTDREFTIDIPTNYDPEKPYRLIFAWHWINASDEAVVSGQTSNGGKVWAYYGLKNQADTSGTPAIFIAPQSRNGTWDQQDHVFFDDMLALAKAELCIDTTRVFATGFSFGAMQTYSLSTNHQKQLRAVSALAPANYNIYLPTNTHEPIAYMSATGMSDTTCPWDGGNNRGAKYAATGHAQDNGCTVPDPIPTTTKGSKSHACYDFMGCKAGYPVKVCTFDGGHIAAHADGGTGDNGTTTWIPKVTWDFFTQF